MEVNLKKQLKMGMNKQDLLEKPKNKPLLEG
jgi:hypothetical protein